MKSSVLVFSTSPNAGSRSRAAATVLLDCLRGRGIPTEFVDVCDLPAVWVTGDGVAAAGALWKEAAQQVERASAVVFAAPIYCFSVGSPARVVIELLSASLEGKPVALITAAGSMRSALAHRDFLNSLADEVSARILPKTVQVTGEDFTESGEISQGIRTRIADLADAVIHVLHSDQVEVMQKVAG
ncbi:MAG TPA: NAD(P)H-dependent oxidoreductase [Terracidiphilus sp.]|nr:NAD(P)H-dependent oxidoreductase [Terracidiphilus sp.]